MNDVNKQLLDALKALFASYKQLADSGDAGNWRIEDQPEGQQALQAIAAAEQAQQADPVAWEVRNGVVTHDFYKTAEDAEEVARDMQKSHDLSGSIAAFNVRPVYAQPPSVAVPDERAAFEAWLQENIDDTDTVRPSKEKVDAYFAVWLARAMLAAAQKGGA